MKKHAVIIGGGLGGLSAAIKLQATGWQVTLLEKNNDVGGKLHEVVIGSHHFDFGPNTITMPHVFREVVQDAGENPDDYFTFEKLDVHTKNVFADRSSFYFSSEKERMKEELLKLDPFAADKYEDYLMEVENLYSLARQHFFHRTFSSWKDYLSLPLAKAMARVKPLTTLDAFHQQFFKDARVRYAFNRYATYIGSSPYTTPATFGLIGHLELVDGVYFTRGGNHRIALGFLKLAKKLGVTLLTNTEVTKLEVKDQRIVAAITDKEQRITGDKFILNGDLLTQFPRLVDKQHRPHFSLKHVQPSISAFVIMAAMKTRLDLHHHHVFFGENPKREFTQLFDDQKFGDDPTIYICTSSKTDETLSPDGDNLFILVNAPPLSADLNEKREPSFVIKERIYDQLEKRGLAIRDNVVNDITVDPTTIAAKFHAFRGSLYGIASNRKRDTFLRPYNAAKDISNLYFVGGSTHPGGGSPMVVLSGSNVARKILSG
ncbi:phytoene desaturase family protein [Evansella cellulosilytica]|uniref:4,4'-diaponeurosporene oxygenase n=1 Tax=Evansella cellulosilytica (strain ATCC 21833 / DSM 2522 / FERM P-1141 / JCM 9156 / N-4) TaxID=649639 RepID=E6TWG2_EVAC2|nr:phytoene desaturase family protein [Evansella cellulosilytica]ADU32225.1 phytoene desaturase [Evansella cellulosilytica DSM 2522]